MAQGWVVYELTDSPLMLGLVNFAALLPVVPISLLAGVLSDRFSRRKLIIATESVLALQALIMAALIWSGMIQVWHIIVLSFILGAAAALEQPARLAFVMDVVGKEDLSNAVALNSSAYNAARIIGPSIAGLIIAAFGEAACFAINGVTYLAVILPLLFIHIPIKATTEDKVPIMGGMVDGLKYTWNSKVIRDLMFIVALASFLTLPYIALMPVFAKDILQVGAQGLGFLLTAVGFGAILGAFGVATLEEGHRGLWLAIANVVGPILLILFCLSNSFYLSLLLVVLVGASNATRQTLANSLIQLNAADEYHGRVMSIFNLLFNGMSRAGALGIGAMAEFASAAWAMGSSAIISAIIGLILLIRLPAIRKLP